ncbi:MAG TPA: FAD-linked oxidase C-terminal domain-containing protein [Dehalococcoidia bacterium]|nr:FAD-linked oxidase C-terminal domain-containing protein [Dehalococcoidia bacterium]
MLPPFVSIPPEAIRDLERVFGAGRVLHTPEDLIVFEYDGTIEKGQPQVVVFPDTTEEVAAAVKIARRYDLPIVPRGAGTGLSGGAVAAVGGVLIAMTRMNRLLDLDTANRTALVQPGLVNLELSRLVAPHGLYYAPDPSSQRACTIGGNVAENAGGPHCLAYGVTTNHVLGLEVVLAGGEVVWLGGGVRDLPGYDLTGVVVGSEGTLCIATKVLVRLLRLPEATRTLLAIFDSVDDASNAVSAIIGAGLVPAALEMLDAVTIRAVEPALHVGYPEDAGAVLLIEVEGLTEATEEDAAKARSIVREAGAREVREASDAADRERLWAGRKGAISALGQLAPNYYILDGVVPRTKLPEVMQEVMRVSEAYGFPIANVFHAGDGNLHPCILFDERRPGETARVLDAGEAIMRVCVDVGGSITGEHGVGLEKRDFMPWIFTPADIETMQRLKTAFGAGERFNPCKAFPTTKGCGEVHSKLVTAFGPDAYV